MLNTTGAADAYNRHLEKDLSSGDIPRVFSVGWVYEIPRLWKISGWQIAGLVRVQAGDAVPVTQATNNNSSLGFAVQRPNRVGDPNEFDGRTRGQLLQHRGVHRRAAVRDRQQLAQSGARTGAAECGPDDRQDVSHHASASTLEFRAEAFNVSNTPPLNDPNGSFGSAAFGSITSAGNPRDFEFVGKLHF